MENKNDIIKLSDYERDFFKSAGVVGMKSINERIMFVFELVQTDYDFESYVIYTIGDLQGKRYKSRMYDQMNDCKVKMLNTWTSVNDILIL